MSRATDTSAFKMIVCDPDPHLHCMEPREASSTSLGNPLGAFSYVHTKHLAMLYKKRENEEEVRGLIVHEESMPNWQKEIGQKGLGSCQFKECNDRDKPYQLIMGRGCEWDSVELNPARGFKR